MASPTDFLNLFRFNESSGAILRDAAEASTGIICTDVSISDTGPATGGNQGYTTDGTQNYTTATTSISRWNSDYSTETHTNNAPFANLPGAPNHLGDCWYYNNLLYTVAEQWPGSCAGNIQDQSIAIYNASDLTYNSHMDISAQDHEVSGITGDVGEGYLYISNFCAPTLLHRYDLITMAYVDDLPLSIPCYEINGIHSDGTYLYLASAIETDGAIRRPAIYRYTLDGVFVDKMLTPINHKIQGCWSDGTKVRFTNSDDTFVRTFTIPATTVPTRAPGGFNFGGNWEADVDNAFPGANGTIIFELTPNRFYNFSAVWDNPIHQNSWESWLASSGELNFRINQASIKVDYILPSAANKYRVAMTWATNGSNRDLELWVDDILRDSGTSAYTPPDSEWYYLAGGHVFNDGGEITLHNFAVFDRVLTPAEIADWVAGPVLTSATGTQTGQTTATGTVVTDEPTGTCYAVVTQSSTTPTKTQIEAGQDHTGSAANWSGSNSVTAVGTESFSATGLTANTTYYFHYVHDDAASHDATAVSSPPFTTAGEGGGGKKQLRTVNRRGELIISPGPRPISRRRK